MVSFSVCRHSFVIWDAHCWHGAPVTHKLTGNVASRASRLILKSATEFSGAPWYLIRCLKLYTTVLSVLLTFERECLKRKITDPKRIQPNPIKTKSNKLETTSKECYFCIDLWLGLGWRILIGMLWVTVKSWWHESALRKDDKAKLLTESRWQFSYL